MVVCKRKVPRYRLIRIYALAIFLYVAAMTPIGAILYIKNVPDLIKAGTIPANIVFETDQDTITDHTGFMAEASLAVDSLEEIQDTVLSSNQLYEHSSLSHMKTFHDSATVVTRLDSTGIMIDISPGMGIGEDSKGHPLMHILKFLLPFLLLAIILNWPYKKYLKLLRKEKTPKLRLEKYVRKNLLRTPWFNAGILAIGYIIGHIYLHFIYDTQIAAQDQLGHELAAKFFMLSIVVSSLTVFLVYIWQRHRVQFVYLEHVYTKEELRTSIFRKQTGRILKRLLSVSMMTTFFPIAIVLFYIVLSISTIESIDVEQFNIEHFKILLGNYSVFLDDNAITMTRDEVPAYIYINGVDTMLMLTGIFTGLATALVYIFLIVKWTTVSMVKPLKELLESMQSGGTDKKLQYAIVRTNDEIGSLTVGYNKMTGDIQQYIDEISDMNRNLEKKVEERTYEISRQKEEIESQRDEILAQKDEIEAQRDEIEAQRNHAIDQRNQISLQKDEMTDSILYARRIQAAILPGEDELRQQVTDYFVFFKPRDIVSGDFYWFAQKEGQLVIVAADCTGHGVPGALMSMIGIAYLSEIVTNTPELSAAIILDCLRRQIISSLHQTGRDGEAKDGMDIALCIIDCKKGKTRNASFAGAHNPLYIIRNGAEGKIDEIKGDRMPIGIYSEQMVPFTNHKLTLNKGDIIYLFTDGYVDQFGGEHSKKLKHKRFRDILSTGSSLSMADQRSEISKKFKTWKGYQEQIDDILIIGVKV